MKVLVAYATVTGNTEIIARAIASAIPGADLKKLPADVNPQDYDFIFAGFWCDKGTPDEVWQAFQKDAKARPIAYFGTMGGDPNSERGQAWVNKVAGLSRARTSRVFVFGRARSIRRSWLLWRRCPEPNR